VEWWCCCYGHGNAKVGWSGSWWLWPLRMTRLCRLGVVWVGCSWSASASSGAGERIGLDWTEVHAAVRADDDRLDALDDRWSCVDCGRGRFYGPAGTAAAYRLPPLRCHAAACRCWRSRCCLLGLCGLVTRASAVVTCGFRSGRSGTAAAGSRRAPDLRRCVRSGSPRRRPG
jgi:hypothetical protein